MLYRDYVAGEIFLGGGGVVRGLCRQETFGGKRVGWLPLDPKAPIASRTPSCASPSVERQQDLQIKWQLTAAFVDNI